MHEPSLCLRTMIQHQRTMSQRIQHPLSQLICQPLDRYVSICCFLFKIHPSLYLFLASKNCTSCSSKPTTSTIMALYSATNSSSHKFQWYTTHSTHSHSQCQDMLVFNPHNAWCIHNFLFTL